MSLQSALIIAGIFVVIGVYLLSIWHEKRKLTAADQESEKTRPQERHFDGASDHDRYQSVRKATSSPKMAPSDTDFEFSSLPRMDDEPAYSRESRFDSSPKATREAPDTQYHDTAGAPVLGRMRDDQVNERPPKSRRYSDDSPKGSGPGDLSVLPLSLIHI